MSKSDTGATESHEGDSGYRKAGTRIRRYVWYLGLIDTEGEVVTDAERFLAEVANGEDQQRSFLAKQAIEIMDMLDRAME